MEPISLGPGNPAMRRGLLKFTGPSVLEMVEFISVERPLPRRAPARVVSPAGLCADGPGFGP
jgi:hypothetical protein